jgi:hypothetical protein
MQCRGDSQVCQQLVTSIKLDISARIAHFSGGALTQGIPRAKGTTAAENLFYWPPRMGGSDGSGLTGADNASVTTGLIREAGDKNGRRYNRPLQ